jgi:hypothetical protein
MGQHQNRTSNTSMSFRASFDKLSKIVTAAVAGGSLLFLFLALKWAAAILLPAVFLIAYGFSTTAFFERARSADAPAM